MSEIRRGEGQRAARAGAAAILLGAGALLSLVMLQAGPAAAQETPEYVRSFIERTGEILDQVGEAVGESESERARRVFSEARHQHERSLGLLNGGQVILALRVSREAREMAMSAGRLARNAFTFEERARLRLERLQDYRDGLLDRAREERHEEALRFIAEAQRQLERAREQYAQKNFEISFNLLQSAESFLNRAARMLFEQGGAERLDRELEQTVELIERVRLEAGAREDRAALDLVERARAELDRGQDAARAGEPWRALRFAAQARRLAAQASARGEAGVDAAGVRELITRWDQRRAEVEEAVRRMNERRAMALIDQAAGHRRTAQNLLEGGRLEEALRQITIAHDLLSKAGERVR